MPIGSDERFNSPLIAMISLGFLELGFPTLRAKQVGMLCRQLLPEDSGH
jgi:hypothetical protein